MEKQFVKISDLATLVPELLKEIQKNILQRHQQFTQKHTYTVDTYEEMKEKIEQGFVLAHWDGTLETAEKVQEELKATIRCLPFEHEQEAGIDPVSGKASSGRVIYAKSY